METQEAMRKEDEDYSEMASERNRQVREAINNFFESTSKKKKRESCLPDFWNMAAEILRIEINYKLKIEEMELLSQI